LKQACYYSSEGASQNKGGYGKERQVTKPFEWEPSRYRFVCSVLEDPPRPHGDSWDDKGESDEYAEHRNVSRELSTDGDISLFAKLP
jgi:hypothetical protein